MRAAVTYLDHRGERWSEGVVSIVDGRARLSPTTADPTVPRLAGVVTGRFTDAHVHLQLVERALLADSVLGHVVDLGGDPAVLRDLHNSSPIRTNRSDTGRVAQFGSDSEELWTRDVAVSFAGAFLTPPRGYPSDRDWAPERSVRELADPPAAEAAVSAMAAAGATIIKVASNSAAGPVFSDEMLAAVISAASRHGLGVVAHAEGPGEAQRAARLGARVLAHAPFTERLTDADLHAMRGRTAWISTLAIHAGDAYDIAVDNVRRFHALGGEVRYGTDMGNGATPVDLHPGEIAALRDAGIDGMDLLRALAPVDPLAPASRLLFFPGAAPDTADPVHARLLTPADLEA